MLQKIQKDLQDQNIELEAFGDLIIFKSMFNDIEWTRRGNSLQIPNKARTTRRDSRKGTGHSVDMEVN